MSQPPNPLSSSDQPQRRPARSIREIRRRRQGENYQSLSDRLFYGFLNALMLGFIGMLIDLGVTLIRSLLDMGDGSVLWLFAPILLVIGFLIGLFAGKKAGEDSMEMASITDDGFYESSTISSDVFRGLGFGILLFAIIWIIMMVMG